jgi:ribosomal protein L29
MKQSDTIIALKKRLLLLGINSVVMDESKKQEQKKIRKAIAAIKAGRIAPEVK